MFASLCFVLIILFPAESSFAHISGTLYVGSCIAAETRTYERNTRIAKGLSSICHQTPLLCVSWTSINFVISVAINYLVLLSLITSLLV